VRVKISLDASGPIDDLVLRRFEDAVEAAQHTERQDHFAVLVSLVVIAQDLFHRRDEADPFLVVDHVPISVEFGGAGGAASATPIRWCEPGLSEEKIAHRGRCLA
jgi:hypothetical protein